MASSRLHRAAAVAALAAVVGCTTRPVAVVRVLPVPDGGSRCALVYVERAAGDVVPSAPLAISPGRPAGLGVVGPEEPRAQYAWAVGFRDVGCREPTEPNEVSGQALLHYGTPVDLQLEARPASVDADGGRLDGGVDAGGADAGGVDAGGVDAGGADAGGQDAGGVDAGLDAGALDAGQDAGPTVCPTPTDCRLAACAGLPCDDQLACGSGKTCGNGQCLAAACTRSGLSCSIDCAESGRCVSRPAPLTLNYTCDDGNLCTVQDRCDGDGGCEGVERGCVDRQQRGACYFGDVCVKSDGGCAPLYADAGAPCQDGDLCTVQDSCDGVGSCRPGSACPATECAAATCGSTGCGQAPLPDGTPCTGGLCNGAGACVPLAVIPSNVPARLARHGASNAWSVAPPSLACVTLIDTGSARDGLDAGGVTIVSGNCLQTAMPAPLGVAQSTDGGVPLIVYLVRDFTLNAGARLRFVGGRPVVILATGNITIDGQLDFSAMDDTSAARNVSGAGGNQDDFCTPGRGASGVDVGSFATGSGGGGFGTAGANGGGTAGRDGADAGPPNGTPELIPLRGGCGSSAVTGVTGPPGRAGGAVQLVAQGRITVRGVISANGHGGFASLSGGGGGGGGGSGGGILLEASELSVDPLARIMAHGGGGASGTDLGLNRADGASPSLNSFASAAGGNCFCAAAPGGAGSGQYTIVPQPGGSTTSGGGGGGGGGHGRIRLNVGSCMGTGAISRISPIASYGRGICP